MVKLNNFPAQQATGTQLNSSAQQSSQFGQPTQLSLNQQLTSQKGLFKIPENLLQLIPWIPVGLEMLTGQKIPATGVLADILSGIQQVQFSLSQIQQNQQQLWTKLEGLESNASNQLTSLSQQVASTNKSFHLLATETKRSLEFNPPSPVPTEKEIYEHV